MTPPKRHRRPSRKPAPKPDAKPDPKPEEEPSPPESPTDSPDSAPDATTGRTPFLVANWKMNLTPSEAGRLARVIAGRVRREVLPPKTDSGHFRRQPPPDPEEAEPLLDLALAPAFPALTAVRDALRGSPLRVAAQDLYPRDEGAFTGAVSAPMLVACGCSLTLVGHSERRRIFGDTDEAVREKAEAALAAGLAPILCVGETAEQRDAGKAEAAVAAQVRAVLDHTPEADRPAYTLAYEPVWAIGTGRTATPEIAAAMHRALRAEVARVWDDEAAAALRILYGGSVNGDNAAALLESPEVDGLLVGGASLEADSFLTICAAAVPPPAPPRRRLDPSKNL